MKCSNLIDFAIQYNYGVLQMNRKIMMIMNPTAGKGTAKTALFTICDRFSATNDFVQVYITQHHNHAKELCIQYAQAYDILVCLGGDGTWNEVISGLMQISKKPEVCYLPSGTVNDFASTLNLQKNASKMMDAIDHHVSFCFDVGKFNESYFTYIAAFGIFTEISYSTSQQSKNTFGKVAYFLEGVKQLTKIPRYHITAQIDGEIIEDDYIFGCITNSKYVGGFTSVNTKYAELDDGLFEVLLIRAPNNPLDVQAIIASLLKREVNEHWMHFCKTSNIIIETTEPIPWTLDGEDGGKVSHAVIKNINKAITILL